MKRLNVSLFLLFLFACNAEEAKEDPCEPNGHIHRSASEGDWCHCSEGYMASESPLGCVVDPSYVPPGPFEFNDSTANACWHAVNGPFESISAPEGTLTRLKTVYTVDLPANAEGNYSGSIKFRAWKTGRFALFVGANIPVTLSEGIFKVDIAREGSVGLCPELAQQFGYELVSKVEYTLQLGPSPSAQVQLVMDEVL